MRGVLFKIQVILREPGTRNQEKKREGTGKRKLKKKTKGKQKEKEKTKKIRLVVCTNKGISL